MSALPHNGTDTSILAAGSMRGRAMADEQYILSFLATCPEGATCDEVELALGLSHQSASARINGLARRFAVWHAGTRPTRSGRKARIYRISVVPA